MTQVPPAHKHAHTHKYTYAHTHRQPHTHTHLGTDGAKNLFETETRLQQANVCAAPVHVCECVQVCECVCAYFTSNSYTLTPFAGFSISFFPCCCRRILFLCSFVFGLKGSSRGLVTGTGEGKGRRGKGGYGEAEEQSKHKLSARWANCCHKDTLPRTFHDSRTRARPQLLVDFIANALPPASLPPSLHPLVTALCSHCFHSCLPYDKQFNLVWQQQQQQP